MPAKARAPWQPRWEEPPRHPPGAGLQDSSLFPEVTPSSSCAGCGPLGAVVSSAKIWPGKTLKSVLGVICSPPGGGPRRRAGPAARAVPSHRQQRMSAGGQRFLQQYASPCSTIKGPASRREQKGVGGEAAPLVVCQPSNCLWRAALSPLIQSSVYSHQQRAGSRLRAEQTAESRSVKATPSTGSMDRGRKKDKGWAMLRGEQSTNSKPSPGHEAANLHDGWPAACAQACPPLLHLKHAGPHPWDGMRLGVAQCIMSPRKAGRIPSQRPTLKYKGLTLFCALFLSREQ